ncbi:MFS transporter [Bradyrhizobium sp. BEA-2-5]|uniref:MFS transporter n=1 Tax=Bradyrhizobium sp. BEA-2-5 TaxID=3080015 RepID=UPI00293E9E03|nr:MFS transporter [Bradyrhizobium sp. BEA-2-5]WOH80293.1 MFS transporter [Bradyrhizobium sp. BEA-2-5]
MTAPFLPSALAALLAYQGFVLAWFVTSVLMTELTDDPVYIALVNAAVQVPLLLVAVPAGIVASQFNRRTLLLAGHMSTVALLLIYAYAASHLPLTRWLLITILFGLGTTASFAMTLWQIVGPDFVAHASASTATILISGSFNAARAIGPLIGATTIGLFGSTPTLLLGVFLVGGAIILLSIPKSTTTMLTAKNLEIPSARKSLNEHLRSTSLPPRTCQAALVSVCGSSVPALLPALVKGQYQNDVTTALGLLTSFLGFGALCGIIASTIIHRHLGLGTILKLTAGMVFVLNAGIALPAPLWLLSVITLVFGASWFLFGTSLNIAVRTEAPSALKSQLVARFLMTFYLGTAIGSVLWGALASHIGVHAALIAASVGNIIAVLVGGGSRQQCTSA